MTFGERRVEAIARCPRPVCDWLVSVLTAATAGVGSLLILGVLVDGVLLRGAGRLSATARLAAGAAALLLLALGGLAALTVVGGLIALRRHGLEARGRPYLPRRPREWKPGVMLRALHGAIRSVAAILSGTPRRQGLLPHELVEVRSLPEILETLDARGTLDALPFMPEMAAFCGRRFRVFRRVEKINDYVTATGLRRLRDTVLLEGLRCDGTLHGGCQACCHLLWKEAWLRRSPGNAPSLRAETASHGATVAPSPHPGSRERDVDRHIPQVGQSAGEQYMCQMTEVARASSHMSWNDPRHYLRDLLLGNVRLGPFLVGVSIEMLNRVQRRFGNGVLYPHLERTTLATSPHEVLDLQPGDLVRVRTKNQIQQTLTADNRNRGLWFDREMLRFCGGEYRVSARVQTLIEEKSGKLIRLTNPCIILDGVTASGEYFAFCPQNESIFWREIWLERVSPPAPARPATGS